MGGNSKAIDIRTGEFIAYAEKIDLSVFDEMTLVKDLYEFFNTLDALYFFKFKRELWPCRGFSNYLAGSTSHLIWFKNFKKYKSIIGDLDIMIDEKDYENFEEFSLLLYDKQIGLTGKFVYLGQDRSSFNTTFLSVFKYTQGDKSVNIQIDFEKHKFDDEQKPTRWSRFSHSSSMEDLKIGLKGVHHKFLLTNIIRVLSEAKNAHFATPASTPDNIRISAARRQPSLLAFSVDYGLRKKYKILKSTPNHYDIYQEVPVKDSECITEPSEIFKTIFEIDPTDKDIFDFHSSVGLCNILKKLTNKETIRKIFNALIINNLYGSHSQQIEKDVTIDSEVKDKLIFYLLKRFKFLNTPQTQEEILLIKDAYYARRINS